MYQSGDHNRDQKTKGSRSPSREGRPNALLGDEPRTTNSSTLRFLVETARRDTTSMLILDPGLSHRSHLRHGDSSPSTPSTNCLLRDTSTPAATITESAARRRPAPILRNIVGSQPWRWNHGYTTRSATGIRHRMARVSNLLRASAESKSHWKACCSRGTGTLVVTTHDHRPSRKRTCIAPCGGV